MRVANNRAMALDEDCPPLEMLGQLFAARGWVCDVAAHDTMSGEIPGCWASYRMRCVLRPEDNVLQLLCLPQIRVPTDRVGAMRELLSLINEQVWLGHFEIWSQGAVLLFRHALLLPSDGALGLEQAQHAVEAAVMECDRFYPAFQFAVWGERTPAEALQAALVDAAGEA